MPNKLPRANKVTQSGFEEQSTVVTLSGSDPDGVITGYALTSLPANGILYLDAAFTQAASINVFYSSSKFYFKPSADFSGSVSFNYVVRDNQGGTSSAASATITVLAVNDAPVFDLNGPATGNSAVLSYTTSSPAALIAPAATVSDIDSANFEGGSLNIAITQNGQASDQLSIAADSTVTIVNGSVYVNGVKIGAIAS